MGWRAGAAGAFAVLLASTAAAQPRVGYLQSAPTPNLSMFRQALRDLGHVEGKTYVIEQRAAEGRSDRLAVLAAELARSRPDVIFADGGTPPTVALKNATSTIPIIFNAVADPVGQGLVRSLARPGGNITGTSVQHPEFALKSLELFRLMLPSARRIAILTNSRNVSLPPIVRQLQEAARVLDLDAPLVQAAAAVELDRAFADLAALQPAGVIILRDAIFTSQAQRVAILAARAGLPTMYGDSILPETGGLSSYGPNSADLVRRAAVLVDKVLKGARPADLPVEQPAKFDFVINLATASALGVSIPQSVLLRADRVIR